VVSFERCRPEDRPVVTASTEAEVSLEERLLLECLRTAVALADRRVLDALVDEEANQARAARRLGVHRNTITNVLRRIRQELSKRGF